ncbi:hypothetical protein OKW50_000691 [Paraburkholderia youngii]|uniref:hypothetical protein n=1 Tax=Paraburkholderia youngii TaxID=2782701 RepID=UPI003D1F5FAC
MTDDEAGLEARLLAFVREGGYPVAGDGSIPEAAAEACLGLSRGTLRKRFALGTLRVPYRVESNRRWYRVCDLTRVLLGR